MLDRNRRFFFVNRWQKWKKSTVSHSEKVIECYCFKMLSNGIFTVSLSLLYTYCRSLSLYHSFSSLVLIFHNIFSTNIHITYIYILYILRSYILFCVFFGILGEKIFSDTYNTQHWALSVQYNISSFSMYFPICSMYTILKVVWIFVCIIKCCFWSSVFHEMWN